MIEKAKEWMATNWYMSPHVFDLIGFTESHNPNYVRYKLNYLPEVAWVNKKPVVTHDETYQERYWGRTSLNTSAVKVINPPSEKLPKGHLPPFYLYDLAFLIPEIVNEGGKVFLVEGAKDVWTSLSMGRFNTIGLLSASITNQENVLKYLTHLGISSIVHYPDLDFAGFESVTRMAAICRNAAITYEARALPNSLSNGHSNIKDLTDLYISYKGDNDRIIRHLDVSPVIPVLSDASRGMARNTRYYQDALYQEVERYFGDDNSYRNNDFSIKGIPCISNHHDNDSTNPQFHWNRKAKYGHCLKCGAVGLVHDVAVAIGINVGNYILDPNEILPSFTSRNLVKEDAHKKAELNVMARLTKGFGDDNPYLNVPEGEFSYSLNSALDDYKARIMGLYTLKHAPIVNPITVLHKYGGAAHMITPPHMSFVLGRSGGYKTSFMTGVIQALAQDGYNVIVWSPEWTREKTADRWVQMYGGLTTTQTAMVQRYYHLKQSDPNKDHTHVLKGLTDRQIQVSSSIADVIPKSVRGEIVYLDNFGADIMNVLQMLEASHKNMSLRGAKPNVFVLDYIQLATTPSDMRGKWDLQDTLLRAKIMTNRLGLWTIVVSQITKDDTRSIDNNADDVQIIQASAGNGIREDYSNFMISLNPVTHKDANGGDIVSLLVAILKNSEGRKANRVENAPVLSIDPLTNRVILE